MDPINEHPPSRGSYLPLAADSDSDSESGEKNLQRQPCALIAHVCRTCTARVPHVYSTSTARVSHVYPTSTARVPHVYRTCTARVPHVYHTCTARIPHAYRTSTARVPHGGMRSVYCSCGEGRLAGRQRTYSRARRARVCLPARRPMRKVAVGHSRCSLLAARWKFKSARMYDVSRNAVRTAITSLLTWPAVNSANLFG